MSYRLAPQEKAIVQSIHKTHYQLGPTVIFSLSATLSWKIGLILIAGRSYGKSTVLNCIKMMSPYQVLKIASATPAGLKFKKIDELLSHQRSVIESDELATVTSGGAYLLEQFLTLLAQLIYDGRYDGGTMRQATIENAEVVVLAAATPSTLEKIMRSVVWEGQASERYVRLYPIYHNNAYEVVENPPKVHLNNHFPEDPEWEVSPEMFRKVYKMFRPQLTPNRADLTAKKILSGHASLCRRNKVVDADAECILLFEPMINIERYFITRLSHTAGGYIDTTPPLFNKVLSEVLYWTSLYPQTYTSLTMNTQGYPQNLLKLVIKGFEKRGWMKTIKHGGKEMFTIDGLFKQKLDNLFEAFGCLGKADDELLDVV